MTFFAKLFLSFLLVSILPQKEYVKASTQNPLIEKSDFFGVEKSTGISETDFFEEIETTQNKFSWTVNMKFGPYISRDEAQQVARDLKM